MFTLAKANASMTPRSPDDSKRPTTYFRVNTAVNIRSQRPARLDVRSLEMSAKVRDRSKTPRRQ